MDNFTVCWIAMSLLFNQGHSPSYKKKIMKSVHGRVKICEQIIVESEKQGIDPLLALSVSFHETRWQNIKSSKGAQGPMGVIKRYHCPRYGKCNLIAAGVSALSKFLMLNSWQHCPALAQYNRGMKGRCAKGRSEHKYATKVLDTYADLMFTVYPQCTISRILSKHVSHTPVFPSSHTIAQ